MEEFPKNKIFLVIELLPCENGELPSLFTGSLKKGSFNKSDWLLKSFFNAKIYVLTF